MAKPPSLVSRFSKSIPPSGAANDSPVSEAVAQGTKQQVSPKQISPSVFQPRRYFDPDTLLDLEASIKKLGILEPLVVRATAKGYELISGERRWRCAKNLQLPSVPIVVVDFSDEDAYLAALHDNSLRDNLNPIDETEYILELLGHWLKLKPVEVTSLLYRIRNQISRGVDISPEDVETTETVTTIIGQVKRGLTPKSFVETRLPLLNLPEEVLGAIRNGSIEYTKAKQIAKIPDPTQRKKILALAVKSGWSIRDIQDHIKNNVDQPEPQPAKTPVARIASTMKTLKASKAWEDPAKWKKIQSWLAKIDQELQDF
jgi:ParB family transcriptional regulator, chromosome partitioning protein